ncbi:unnamed protein product [Caenorhabditis brenneri]
MPRRPPLLRLAPVPEDLEEDDEVFLEDGRKAEDKQRLFKKRRFLSLLDSNDDVVGGGAGGHNSIVDSDDEEQENKIEPGTFKLFYGLLKLFQLDLGHLELRFEYNHDPKVVLLKNWDYSDLDIPLGVTWCRSQPEPQPVAPSHPHRFARCRRARHFSRRRRSVVVEEVVVHLVWALAVAVEEEEEEVDRLYIQPLLLVEMLPSHRHRRRRRRPPDDGLPPSSGECRWPFRHCPPIPFRFLP